MKMIFALLIFLQIAGTSKLKDTDRDHLLKSDSFDLITDVNKLPDCVRQSFTKIAHEKTFLMANPGEEFQETDVIDKDGLPDRRLILAGLSKDHCFLHYEMGGVGHSYLIVFFRLNNDKAKFIWGANAWKGYEKMDSLRNAIIAKKYDDSMPYIW